MQIGERGFLLEETESGINRDALVIISMRDGVCNMFSEPLSQSTAWGLN